MDRTAMKRVIKCCNASRQVQKASNVWTLNGCNCLKSSGTRTKAEMS